MRTCLPSPLGGSLAPGNASLTWGSIGDDLLESKGTVAAALFLAGVCGS